MRSVQYDTAKFREAHGIDKTHELDAYCIAMSAYGEDLPHVEQCFPETQEAKQYRRHDRARIKCQKERTYYFEGKAVAKNRHKRTGQSHAGKPTVQSYDSLEEWYAKQVEEFGVQEAEKRRSRLTVKKSTRSHNRMGRILPGALFKYKGHRYVMSGQITGGKYYRAEGQGKWNFPAKECEIPAGNRGIAYL